MTLGHDSDCLQARRVHTKIELSNLSFSFSCSGTLNSITDFEKL